MDKPVDCGQRIPAPHADIPYTQQTTGPVVPGCGPALRPVCANAPVRHWQAGPCASGSPLPCRARSAAHRVIRSPADQMPGHRVPRAGQSAPVNEGTRARPANRRPPPRIGPAIGLFQRIGKQVGKDTAFKVFEKRLADRRLWSVVVALPFELACTGEIQPSLMYSTTVW